MTASIRETYIDFYRFLRNPVNQPAEDQSFKQKVTKLFGALAIEIPVIVLIGIIDHGIENSGFIDTADHKTEVRFQQLPIWKFVLFSIIITGNYGYFREITEAVVDETIKN